MDERNKMGIRLSASGKVYEEDWTKEKASPTYHTPTLLQRVKARFHTTTSKLPKMGRGR